MDKVSGYNGLSALVNSTEIPIGRLYISRQLWINFRPIN